MAGIESAQETPVNLQYPSFELCNYYAAEVVVQRLDGEGDGRGWQVHTRLAEASDEQEMAPRYLAEAADAMLDAFAQWQGSNKLRHKSVRCLDSYGFRSERSRLQARR